VQGLIERSVRPLAAQVLCISHVSERSGYQIDASHIRSLPAISAAVNGTLDQGGADPAGYSWRRASMGASRAAFRAGKYPNTTPMNAENPNPSRTTNSDG
jgi:hypothetical protein